MYRDLDWLEKEIHLLREADTIGGKAHQEIVKMIRQLDGITEEQALNKIAEGYALTPNDIPWILDRYVANDLIDEGGEDVIVLNKPAVPQFVADYLEDNRGDWPEHIRYLLQAHYGDVWYLEDMKVDNGDMTYEEAVRISEWADVTNVNTLFNLIHGYTVEKEPKYVLAIDITDKGSKTDYTTYLNKRGIFHSMDNDSFNDEDFHWAEKDIREMDNGDLLFEHFAKKVSTEQEEAL